MAALLVFTIASLEKLFMDQVCLNGSQMSRLLNPNLNLKAIIALLLGERCTYNIKLILILALMWAVRYLSLYSTSSPLCNCIYRLCFRF